MKKLFNIKFDLIINLFKAAEERADQIHQQQQKQDNQLKSNNDINLFIQSPNDSIVTNDSLNTSSNVFTAVPTHSLSGLNSTSTNTTTPTSLTNILSPPVSSYVQQTTANNSAPAIQISPITSQFNKILKKNKKDEKKMLLSDDEF